MSVLEGSKYQEHLEDNKSKSWDLKKVKADTIPTIITSLTEEPTIQNKQLEDLISQIRDSFNGSVEVYTKGSCIRFCMILKTVYPRGIILYNSDHAIFELNNRYYDITGEVASSSCHLSIEEYGILKCYELMNLKYTI